ncbi:MAG TPA: sialidase family protein [Gemmatimonadaceae bacterium]|nr:sialidase family protein [Gemmatimonadaceae bacterium]
MRLFHSYAALLSAALLAACSDVPAPSDMLNAPTDVRLAKSAADGPTVNSIANVTSDTTAQNETPLAVNPRNSQNLITGNNDWNYNDGCGVNASFDGGRTWTRTLPNGFIPGVTRFTNDPDVPGTGDGDFGGDPAAAFAPDGTAYFACFSYNGTSTMLLLSRSTDGGATWQAGVHAIPSDPLALVSAFNGNGIGKGSNGQFPDHEAMWVGADGTIYVTWAQFHGFGSNSPVWISTSRDGGRSFGRPVKVSSGNVRSDQDQRIVTNSDGSVAYVTFDNSIQGGKGTAIYVSKSTDHGQTWGTPFQLGVFSNPVCLFPPYCFNITGGQFRGPGSYPAPAYNPVDNRLYVAYADIDVDGQAKIFITSAAASDLTKWSPRTVVASAPKGDRFAAELGISPNGRIDVAFYDRSYTANSMVDLTFATSSDGGATWRSVRVSKSSFDPSAWGVPSGSGVRPFIGDYNGIVSLASSAGMTWTGAGTKNYGTLPTNLEIYFASVSP